MTEGMRVALKIARRSNRSRLAINQRRIRWRQEWFYSTVMVVWWSSKSQQSSCIATLTRRSLSLTWRAKLATCVGLRNCTGRSLNPRSFWQRRRASKCPVVNTFQSDKIKKRRRLLTSWAVVKPSAEIIAEHVSLNTSTDVVSRKYPINTKSSAFSIQRIWWCKPLCSYNSPKW